MCAAFGRKEASLSQRTTQEGDLLEEVVGSALMASLFLTKEKAVLVATFHSTTQGATSGARLPPMRWLPKASAFADAFTASSSLAFADLLSSSGPRFTNRSALNSGRNLSKNPLSIAIRVRAGPRSLRPGVRFEELGKLVGIASAA